MKKKAKPSKKPLLYVAKAKKKGKGAFTRKALKKGALVTYLSGFVLPTSKLKKHTLALQIDDDMWLCSEGGALDDFINHSCEPNTAFLSGGLKLYALRDIKKGEEITFDYSTAMADEEWYLDCKCASAKCRGTVKPFQQNSTAFCRSRRDHALDYIRKTYG